MTSASRDEIAPPLADHRHDAGVDPVAVFDAMWEAGTSLFGSYVWLSDHAETPADAEHWWALALAVKDRRASIDATDVATQRRATTEFIEEERRLRPLVRV